MSVGGKLSEPRELLCGVPQGSILGPLLFLLYINDMEAVCSCPLFLYADDSALLVTGDSIDSVGTGLSTELREVSNWLNDNRLSLHLGKSEFIIFGSEYNLRNKSRL